MRGIVGYVCEKHVVPVILDGVRRLEYRGYDSAGIAVAGNGEGLQVRRTEGKLRNLKESIRRKPPNGTYALATPAGPPTDVLQKKMRTRIVIAPARSLSFTMAASRTISA